ncbi:MAG: hypothetical protein M1825_002059 [Sarcosagium campestre]|nr:MAG: hypothetical protein M1825_002059 [Sarcosagium campestre]
MASRGGNYVSGNAFSEAVQRDPVTSSASYPASPTPEPGSPIKINLPESTPKRIREKKPLMILPATPLLSPYKGAKGGVVPKGRTVTDSAIPMPLSIPRKAITIQSNSKESEHSSAASSCLSSNETARAASSCQSSDAQTDNTQATTSFRASEGDAKPPKHSQDGRQVKSTPVKYAKTLPEVHVKSPDSQYRYRESPSDDYHTALREYTVPRRHGTGRSDGIMFGDIPASPTRASRRVRPKNINLVVPAERVPSMSGLLGHVKDGTLISPTSVYSPGFSPGVSPTVRSNESLALHVPTHTAQVPPDHPPPPPPKPVFQPSLDTGQAHASDHGRLRNTSLLFRDYADDMAPPFTASSFNGIPPQTPGHRSSVADPSENTLHLIMGVHHHLDTELGAISHSLSAKHDNLVDHLIRKHEASLETTSKWFRDLAARFGTLEHAVGKSNAVVHSITAKLSNVAKAQEKLEQLLEQNLATENAAIEKLTDKSDDMLAKLESLDRRFDELDAKFDAGRCKCHSRGASNGGGGAGGGGGSGIVSGTSMPSYMMARANVPPPLPLLPPPSSPATFTSASPMPPPDLRDHPAFAGFYHGGGGGSGSSGGPGEMAPWYRHALYQDRTPQG